MAEWLRQGSAKPSIGVQFPSPPPILKVGARIDRVQVLTEELSSISDEELIEHMRAAFKKTPLHGLLGLELLETEGGKAIVSMPVAEGAFSLSGNLHGGSIATLCDVACGVAASRASTYRPRETTIVTADIHIRYLGRPRSDLVIAEAHVVRAGRTLIVIECTVADDEGRLVARADFAAMLVPFREPLRQAANPDHLGTEI